MCLIRSAFTSKIGDAYKWPRVFIWIDMSAVVLRWRRPNLQRPPRNVRAHMCVQVRVFAQATLSRECSFLPRRVRRCLTSVWVCVWINDLQLHRRPVELQTSRFCLWSGYSRPGGGGGTSHFCLRMSNSTSRPDCWCDARGPVYHGS